MKIHEVGAEFFHAGGRAGGRTKRQTDRQTDRRQTDRQTDRYMDMTKIIIAFRNISNDLKMEKSHVKVVVISIL
jgi:hypothetical protein